MRPVPWTTAVRMSIKRLLTWPHKICKVRRVNSLRSLRIWRRCVQRCCCWTCISEVIIERFYSRNYKCNIYIYMYILDYIGIECKWYMCTVYIYIYTHNIVCAFVGLIGDHSPKGLYIILVTLLPFRGVHWDHRLPQSWFCKLSGWAGCFWNTYFDHFHGDIYIYIFEYDIYILLYNIDMLSYRFFIIYIY